MNRINTCPYMHAWMLRLDLTIKIGHYVGASQHGLCLTPVKAHSHVACIWYTFFDRKPHPC